MKQHHQEFFDQLAAFRKYLLKVSDVTDAEAEKIPQGFKNNIRWNLGHIYIEQYMWIKTLVQEDVDVNEQLNDWFGFSTSPENFTSETPSLSELRTLLEEQIGHIRETYGDRLEEVFPPTEVWGMTTIEQVLRWTSFHEGMHLQKILDIKKLINA